MPFSRPIPVAVRPAPPESAARRRRGGVDEFAQRMRVLEVLVVDEPHRAAHQMGRAERLAPRVVVRVARGDLKVVVRGEGANLDAVLDEQPRRPEVQRRLIRVALPAQTLGASRG